MTTTTSPYAAFAIAHLRSVTMGDDIAEYLERIDTTLEPFGGSFVVHGSRAEVLEGTWPGDVIVIGFPSREQARRWYDSPAYQDIVELRTANSDGSVILVDAVEDGHRATDILSG